MFEAKKAFFLQAGQTLNEIYGREVCEVSVKDQYYNMYDVIKDNMECVNVAKAAMEKAGITPICDPIRGGTDGSKISFMGIPTPNIFTGVENPVSYTHLFWFHVRQYSCYCSTIS